MRGIRILRRFTFCAVLLLMASIPCFANGSQLHLDFNQEGGGIGFGQQSGIELGSLNVPAGGFGDILLFNDQGGTLGDVSFAFSFGPVTSCDGETSGGIFSGNCSFGPGGTMEIVVNSFGAPTTTYTGILLNSAFIIDQFDPETGSIQATEAGGTFTLNGFNGVGSFFIADAGGSGELNADELMFSGTATPEPGTLALLGTGLLGLGPLVRRGLQAHKRR